MFGSMKIYTVHVKPEDVGSRFKPVFIKEGFNGTAFIFTLFWAFYQRLWGVALALIVITGILLMLLKAQFLTHTSVTAIHLGVHFIVGFHANDWIRSRLNRKGYILSDVTAADSYLRAQQRYLERYVTATA